MQTILVTGVGKGIGKAIMEKFLNEGNFVIGIYHTKQPNIENENLRLIQLEITKKESIEACAEEVSCIGKKVDIIINNAGVLLDEDDTEVIEGKLRDTLEVNLIGTSNFTEKILPFMVDGGHIVNISSTAGSLGLPYAHDHYPHHYPAYKISKAALNMYTKTIYTNLPLLGRRQASFGLRARNYLGNCAIVSL